MDPDGPVMYQSSFNVPLRNQVILKFMVILLRPAILIYSDPNETHAMDTTLLISSMLNLFIAGVFMGLSFVVLRRAEDEGTILWIDLGKTLVMVSACLVAQSLLVVSVAMVDEATFKFLWLIVFLLFAITGYLVYRYASRTSKMLEVLLGGGDD
jgi:hypothetical protein